MDYSKFSDEELEKIASGMGNGAPKEPGGLSQTFKGLGKGYLNYAGGALRGMGQSAGDLGASAINWPISGIEHLIGKQLPHVPHPHLINKNPESMGESIGQILGQISAGIAFPGGVGVKTAQLANKVYQAIRSGKQLPALGKLLAAGIGGAAEGSLGNEENRKLGAELGFATGGGAQGISSLINFAKSIKSKNIAKAVKANMDNLHNSFSDRFESALQAGEESGANKFLKSQKGNISLLKGAGENIPKESEKHLTYALEKYNANPSLTNAHYAQRDINKLVNKFSGARPGTKEYDAYKEALKIKNNLLLKISEAFKKSGAEQHGENYAQSRIDYKNTLGPYLNVPEIRALRRGDLRESKFADAIINKAGEPGPQEQFMTKVGKQYPELVRREKIKKVAKNPVTHVGLGIAIGTLPYEIRKLLGQ